MDKKKTAYLVLGFLAFFMALSWDPDVVYAGNQYFMGGEVKLPSNPTDVFWIYTGTTGNLVHPDREATFSVKKNSPLLVGKDGTYKAKRQGTATILVTRPGSTVKESYVIRVVNYPKNFALSPKSKTMRRPWQDDRYPMQTTFHLKGVSAGKVAPIDISVDDEGIEPTITRKGNAIKLVTTIPGECNVKVNYAGVEKVFQWKMNGIGVDNGAMLLSPNTNKMIEVSFSKPSRFRWSSSNKKIAIVSGSGRVVAKNIGNAIITGVEKSEGYRVGCVVSVTTPAKVNAIERGRKIAEGTYSLSRRMQQGYYDCSSLVWRAYVVEGIHFGVPLGGYAPVAGNEEAYLERRGKIVSTWKESDMKKMRYLAGDLMFRTNTGNGHYRGINHVEMIAGYQVRYNTRRKPDVCCIWVNRVPEYSYSINDWDIIGRP